MERPFYRDRLIAHGIAALVPAETERAPIHRVIYDELVRGIVSEPSRTVFVDIIRRLVDEGVQGVVAGCTEIELLVSQDDSPVPVFPTTRLHVEAAVTASLAPAR